jgi:hypothetical protein
VLPYITVMASTQLSRAERWACHREIIEATKRLQLPPAVAWAMHDQKAEQFVTAGLVGELNRDKRRAWTEHKRIDLVLVREPESRDDPEVEIAYEAKAERLSWFLVDVPTGVLSLKSVAVPRKNPWWWRGGNLRWDLDLEAGNHRQKRWGDYYNRRAGLFYLVEVSPTTTQKKFGKHRTALKLEAAKSIVVNCVGAELVDWASCPAARLQIDLQSQAEVVVHVAVFDVGEDGLMR